MWTPFLWSSNQTFPWTAEPPWHHTTEVQTLTKAARALLPSSQRLRHHRLGPSRASQFCRLAPQTGHGNSKSVGNFCIYLKSLWIIIKKIQSSKLTKFFRCWNYQYNEELKIGWHMCNGHTFQQWPTHHSHLHTVQKSFNEVPTLTLDHRMAVMLSKCSVKFKYFAIKVPTKSL